MDTQIPEQNNSAISNWPSPLVYEFFTPPDVPVSLLDVLDMDLDSLKGRLKKLQAYMAKSA